MALPLEFPESGPGRATIKCQFGRKPSVSQQLFTVDLVPSHHISSYIHRCYRTRNPSVCLGEIGSPWRRIFGPKQGNKSQLIERSARSKRRNMAYIYVWRATDCYCTIVGSIRLSFRNGWLWVIGICKSFTVCDFVNKLVSSIRLKAGQESLCPLKPATSAVLLIAF